MAVVTLRPLRANQIKINEPGLTLALQHATYACHTMRQFNAASCTLEQYGNCHPRSQQSWRVRTAKLPHSPAREVRKEENEEIEGIAANTQ